MVRWVRLKSAREKIQGALDYGTYPWGPGAVLRYNSTQTFLLAVAMDAYLKRREGPGVHLWDMVRREVFQPIGIAHAPKLHTIEADGSRGIPLLGYDVGPRDPALLRDRARRRRIRVRSAGALRAVPGAPYCRWLRAVMRLPPTG